MKKINLLKIALLFNLLIFLNCYEQIISISDNFNGIITYKITYNNDFNNLSSYLVEKHGIDLNTSILFDKKNVEDIVAKSKDIKILDYSIKKSGYNSFLEMSLIFSNISSMPAAFPYKFFVTRTFEENRTVFYSTNIALNKIYDNKDIRALYKTIKDEDKKIIDSYLKIIKLKFVYKSEKQTLSTNIGTLSQDKKEVQYATTMFEQMNNKSDTEILISFKK